MGSAELYDSRLDGVHLDGGRLDHVNLRSARLTDVLVSGCIIGELDLTGCGPRGRPCGTARSGHSARRCPADGRRPPYQQLPGISGIEGPRDAMIDVCQVQLPARFLADSMGLRVEG